MITSPRMPCAPTIRPISTSFSGAVMVRLAASGPCNAVRGQRIRQRIGEIALLVVVEELAETVCPSPRDHAEVRAPVGPRAQVDPRPVGIAREPATPARRLGVRDAELVV